MPIAADGCPAEVGGRIASVVGGDGLQLGSDAVTLHGVADDRASGGALRKP